MQDVKIQPLGDLRLEYLNEDQTLSSSLVRRISTPLDGYSRMVKTQDGYQELDTTYGSSLYTFLSLPITELEDDYILDVLRESARQDSRVEVIDATRAITARNTVSLSITYRKTQQPQEVVTTVAEINV